MTRGAWLRLAFFAFSFAAVVFLVESCAEGEEALGRSFLRNLLRALF